MFKKPPDTTSITISSIISGGLEITELQIKGPPGVVYDCLTTILGRERVAAPETLWQYPLEAHDVAKAAHAIKTQGDNP